MTCSSLFFPLAIDQTQWDLALGGDTILEVTPNLSSHNTELHELAPHSRNPLWHPVTEVPPIPGQPVSLCCPEVRPLHGIGMTTATHSNSLCQIPWDISIAHVKKLRHKGVQ